MSAAGRRPRGGLDRGTAGRARAGPDRDGDRLLDEARTRLLVGADPRQGLWSALPPRARRALEVAAAVGAPAVPALDAALAARDDVRRRDRALHVATAQARAVAAGLGALPVVVVPLLGAVLDEPLWRFYLTPAGAVVGAVGVGLGAAGVGLALHFVRRAVGPPRRPSAATPVLATVVVYVLAGPVAAAAVAGGAVVARRRRRPAPAAPPGVDEVADLVATAMAGGLSGAAALRTVAEVLPQWAAPLRRGGLCLDLGREFQLPAGIDRVGTVLAAAVRHGAPAAPALRRVAADQRGEEHARALAAAERLPALLAFPTALLLLPACVLLVGAPLLAAGLSAAGTTP